VTRVKPLATVEPKERHMIAVRSGFFPDKAGVAMVENYHGADYPQ
jgi:hypothetical protein